MKTCQWYFDGCGVISLTIFVLVIFGVLFMHYVH
jgi:hypothetical protein